MANKQSTKESRIFDAATIVWLETRYPHWKLKIKA